MKKTILCLFMVMIALNVCAETMIDGHEVETVEVLRLKATDEPTLSAVGTSLMYHDDVTNKAYISVNGGAYFEISSGAVSAFTTTTDGAYLDGDVSITGNLSANGTVTCSNVSGVNTGDQDLSSYLTKAASFAGDVTGTYDAIDVTDDGHAHTGATLSGIDISDDTNLAGGTNITLADDTLNLDDTITGDLTMQGNVSIDGSLSVGSLITPYAQTVTVAKSGGDYTSIQEALSASGTLTAVIVYPGDYTDTINFTANRQIVKAAGRGNVTVVEQDDTDIADFGAYSGCSIQGLRLKLNDPDSSDRCVVKNSAGDCSIINCRIDLTTDENIAGAGQPAIICATGGTVTTKQGEFYYTHTGDTTNGIKSMFDAQAGSNILIKRPCAVDLTASGSAAATTIAISTTTGIVDVESACNITVYDDTASIVAGLGYIAGSSDDDFSENTISVTGGGSNACYGIYHAGTGTIRSAHNRINVTGGATNYGYFVGATSTLNSHFDDVRAASGNQISGTLNAAYSDSDGDFYVSKDLTVGNNVFYVDGTAGNVGIGTTSPGAKLEVNGDWTLGTTLTQSGGNAYYKGVEVGTGDIDGSGTANYVTKWSDSDTVTDSVMYDDGTNVGIGITSPTATLDARNSTTTVVALTQSGVLTAGEHTLDIHSNSAHTTADTALVKITQDNASATEPALEIDMDGGSNDGAFHIINDGTNYGLRIDQNGVLASKRAMLIYSNAAHVAANSELVKIIQDNASATEPCMGIQNDGSGPDIELGGGQIAFPATQNASADANTLDDYEEGTWTPVMTFGGATTGMSQSGTGVYTKVGRHVSITGYVVITNVGSASGNAVITGLPFTSISGNGGYAACAVGETSKVSFSGKFNVTVNQGATTIALRESATNGTASYIDDNDFTATASFNFSATYEIGN